MFSKSLALTLLLIQGAHSLKITSKNKAKHEFIQNMKNAMKEHGEQPMQMNKNRLINKSVHKPGLRAKPSAPSSETKPAHVSKTPDERQGRKLTSWWNFWSSENGDYDDFQNWSEEQEAEEDGAEQQNTWWDYNGWSSSNNQDDMWNNADNQTLNAESFRDFSIKYAGCAALTSFVDSEDGADPYYNQNFITYRLCPSDTCQSNSWQGCKSTYGEYMMNLQDFLEIQQDFIEEQLEYYCNFCQTCYLQDKFYSGYYEEKCEYDEYGQKTCYQVNQAGNKVNEEHSCYLYDQCAAGYDVLCDGGDANNQNQDNAEVDETVQKQLQYAEYNLEDFFSCEAINLNAGNDDYNSEQQENVQIDDKFRFDEGYYDILNQNNGVAYIGTHCVDGVIGLGIFSDESCTHYVGNKLNFYNETDFQMDIDAIEDIYIPQGCLSCAEDNIHLSNYWFPQDQNEYKEYQQEYENGYSDYVSEICSNMYESSAKCHSHFGEDYDLESMGLELGDAEYAQQETACNFIDDVLKGRVDDEGYVYSHQNERTFVSDFFASFGADDLEDNVTGGQIAGLLVTGAAAAAMGAYAYELKQKVEAIAGSDGLMANEAAVAS